MSGSNRLGRYQLGERLGEGGMAEVFRAEMPGAAGFRKAVAIKRVKPALADDERVCAAFLQEAEVARRLEHGGIVQIYDLGIERGVPYLVIELVDGVSLQTLLARTGATRGANAAAGGDRAGLEVGAALAIVEQVAAALHHAHQLRGPDGAPQAVIHRDVNPKNILISRDGVVKLTDFGIAKARHLPSETLPGTIKGTLGYLSPEQARGGPIDATTDQFATGVVLHELLTGQNPLAIGDNLHEYVAKLERGLPAIAAPPPVDDELIAIAARAVAIEPGDRFPSMDELRCALERWRVGAGLRTAPDELARRVRALRAGATGAPPERAPRPLGRALELQLDGSIGLQLDDSIGLQLDDSIGRQDTLPHRATEPGGTAPRVARRGLSPTRLTAAALALIGAGLVAAVALGLSPWSDRAVAISTAPGAESAESAPPTPANASGAALPKPDNDPNNNGDPDNSGDTDNNGDATMTTAATAAGPRANAARPANADAPAATTSDPPAPKRAAPPAPKRAADAPNNTTGARPPTGRRAGTAGQSPDRARAAASKTPGKLLVNLLPYARVRIGRTNHGQTPVALPLAPGHYTVELENPDTGQKSTRQVRIAPGQTVTINHW